MKFWFTFGCLSCYSNTNRMFFSNENYALLDLNITLNYKASLSSSTLDGRRQSDLNLKNSTICWNRIIIILITVNIKAAWTIISYSGLSLLCIC